MAATKAGELTATIPTGGLLMRRGVRPGDADEAERESQSLAEPVPRRPDAPHVQQAEEDPDPGDGAEPAERGRCSGRRPPPPPPPPPPTPAPRALAAAARRAPPPICQHRSTGARGRAPPAGARRCSRRRPR